MARTSSEQGGDPVFINLVPEHGGTLAYTNLMRQVNHVATGLGLTPSMRKLALQDDLPVFGEETIAALKSQADSMIAAAADHKEFVRSLVAKRGKFDDAIQTLGYQAIGIYSYAPWLPSTILTRGVREITLIADGTPKDPIESVGHLNDLEVRVHNIMPKDEHPFFALRSLSFESVVPRQQR